MRILKKEKKMQEIDVTLEDYNLCDKCNEKIGLEDIYDAFDFCLYHKTGTSYPEGGSGQKQEVELCKKCSVELMALLKTNGYRITDSEWNN